MVLSQHHQTQNEVCHNTCVQSTVFTSYVVPWPDNNPHCETVRRAAADYTNEHSLKTTLQHQYIGTVGSTLSEYACIPPSKLLSCAKPSDCKYSAACWDLMPWWHIKIVCLNGSSSLVTVRPQSRILQDNLHYLEVAACMPSLVRLPNGSKNR